ncbi:hypothetical protein [Actinomadura rifamycini]|uniref:hypothetical protein n=1 Tax=Actinomadura rifamycini TaxID=31962 RepID=UPI0004180C6B|nr:hypothetical protein [Actinomadura rifamycini]
MSTRDARENAVSARPAAPARRAGRARPVMHQMWVNRPSLGTVACLLAVPGTANVLLGWPLWPTAAAQCSLWLLLMVAVSVHEVRHQAPAAPQHDEPDASGGHEVPTRWGTGEEEGR